VAPNNYQEWSPIVANNDGPGSEQRRWWRGLEGLPRMKTNGQSVKKRVVVRRRTTVKGIPKPALNYAISTTSTTGSEEEETIHARESEKGNLLTLEYFSTMVFQFVI